MSAFGYEYTSSRPFKLIMTIRRIRWLQSVYLTSRAEFEQTKGLSTQEDVSGNIAEKRWRGLSNISGIGRVAL